MKRKYAFKSEPMIDYLEEPGEPPSCDTCGDPCRECGEWWRDRYRGLLAEFRAGEEEYTELLDKRAALLDLVERVGTLLDRCA